MTTIHMHFIIPSRIRKAVQSALFVLTGILFALPALASAEELLWELNLNDYTPGAAPELGENLEIREEDGQRMLSKQDSGTQFFPKTILPIKETQGWNNIIFRVRYREQEPSGIRLVVKNNGSRSEAEYLWYYVYIRKDGIEIACHLLSPNAVIDSADPRLRSFVKYEDSSEAPLVTGEWITAEVQVGDEVVKVSVETEDGSIRKAEFNVLPGGGGVRIMAMVPTDILSATVRDAEGEVTASE